jgi:hypothetical protein
MSIRERLEKSLVENGMWPDEAKEVLNIAAEDEVLKPMEFRWDDAAEGYPQSLFAVIWLRLKEIAVEWIDKNKPQHFARTILTS